jgi:cytochrome c oxidase cbb3-type subunit 3
MSIGRVALLAVVVALLVAGAAGWLLTAGRPAQTRVELAYPEGVAAVVPLGISAGEPPAINVSTANPLANDPTAPAEGKKLFGQLNCAGCHGYDAKGGMGPDLTDTAWRYGGTPIDIYKSIYEGRPQGMPAWGNSVPPQTIWQLVAYIQSLGGSFAPLTTSADRQPGPGQGLGAQAGQKQ